MGAQIGVERQGCMARARCSLVEAHKAQPKSNVSAP